MKKVIVEAFIGKKVSVYAAAVNFLNNSGIRNYNDYCSWLYEEVVLSKLNKLRGYYYSVFTKPDNVLAFLAKQQQKKQEKQRTKAICPVCGNEIDKTMRLL